MRTACFGVALLCCLPEATGKHAAAHHHLRLKAETNSNFEVETNSDFVVDPKKRAHEIGTTFAAMGPLLWYHNQDNPGQQSFLTDFYLCAALWESLSDTDNLYTDPARYAAWVEGIAQAAGNKKWEVKVQPIETIKDLVKKQTRTPFIEQCMLMPKRLGCKDNGCLNHERDALKPEDAVPALGEAFAAVGPMLWFSAERQLNRRSVSYVCKALWDVLSRDGMHTDGELYAGFVAGVCAGGKKIPPVCEDGEPTYKPEDLAKMVEKQTRSNFLERCEQMPKLMGPGA